MRHFVYATLLGLWLAVPAGAGGFVLALTDAKGAALSDAVVEVFAPAGLALPPNRLAQDARIDQRMEQFFPLVSLIRSGGRVTFLNNDTTRHQVYSFSAIKKFQFELKQGQRSEAVVFDKPGVAAIGCNIHDSMITYVYVADSPFAALSKDDGRVSFAELPAGAYEFRIWHPQLPQDKPGPSQHIVIGEGVKTLAVKLPVTGAKHAMHMGGY